MKANRKFVEADDAVSPVIAVILMVAITVVLAATVFVLVSDIGSNTAKNAPQMGWADDESGDSFSITQAPQQLEWDDFQVKMTGAPADNIYVAFNAAVDDSDADCQVEAAYREIALAACTGAPLTTDTVNAGDALFFCSVTPLDAEEDVTVTILHDVSNAISHEFTFASLKTCP